MTGAQRAQGKKGIRRHRLRTRELQVVNVAGHNPGAALIGVAERALAERD